MYSNEAIDWAKGAANGICACDHVHDRVNHPMHQWSAGRLVFGCPGWDGEDEVKAPAHYNQAEVECWDVIEMLGLGYLDGNAMKYLWRHREKGEAKTDIQKCIAFLQRYEKTL